MAAGCVGWHEFETQHITKRKTITETVNGAKLA